MSGDIDGAVQSENSALALLPPGPSHTRAEIGSVLAKYLVEQKSYSQAEPLLLSLHQQLIDQTDSTTEQKHNSKQQVVDLYKAWRAAEPDKGYDHQATKWQARLTPH